MTRKKLRPVTVEDLESVEATRAWLDEAGEHWGFPRVIYMPSEEDLDTDYVDGVVYIYKSDTSLAVLELLYLFFKRKGDDTGFFDAVKKFESSGGFRDIDLSDIGEY